MKLPFNALVRAVERSGVDVRTGKEADADLVAALEPARVVIATGSRPVVPDVPGLVDPLTAEAVLTGKRAAGPRVLILGGGLVGIELAEHLAGLGRTVVIVELLDEVARDMEAISRTLSLRKLQALHVGIHTGTRLVRIADGEAFVHHGDDEERSIGRFDSFLVAVGATAYDPLSRQLKDLGLAVDVIGDARRPGQVFDATTAGREVVAAMRAGETGRSRVG